MQSRVNVIIGGASYTLVSNDGEEHIRKLAEYVNGRLDETNKGSHLSRLDCAVLTAMNIADDLMKEQSSSENLRRQIKDMVEENAKQKQELSKLRQDLFKAQQQKK